MAKIQMEGFRCERCKHEWAPRTSTIDLPRVCPKCKSAYWNKPKKEPGTIPEKKSEEHYTKHAAPSNHEREIALLEYGKIVGNRSIREYEREKQLEQWYQRYGHWFKNEPIGARKV